MPVRRCLRYMQASLSLSIVERCVAANPCRKKKKRMSDRVVPKWGGFGPILEARTTQMLQPIPLISQGLLVTASQRLSGSRNFAPSERPKLFYHKPTLGAS